MLFLAVSIGVNPLDDDSIIILFTIWPEKKYGKCSQKTDTNFKNEMTIANHVVSQSINLINLQLNLETKLRNHYNL